MLNRRRFIASTAVLAALPTSLLLEGCDNTTVAEFVQLIGQDAASFATYFGQTGVASQITMLAGQIATDITNWQSGKSAANDAIQAIQALIGLLNSLTGLIPANSPYVGFEVLLLSALAGLLALLPQSTALAARKVIPLAVRGQAVVAAHYSGLDKKSMTQAKKDFSAQWKALEAAAPLKK